MSTDTQQLNNQESSAQTPIILEAGQRVTAKIKDIQSFVEPVNALLKPEKRLTNVVSLSEITQALIPANLNLKDEVIELNPKVGETVSTIVELDENSEYIGFNSITVRTKTLENRVVPLLTPAMLNAEGGLTITKTSDDFCGMNQVEIQDIALASNIEYTLVPSDLESTDTVEFDFLTFDRFSDEIKKQYKDKVFGAKDLTVNVPLVEEHIFYVDATNIGKTFVPADIPEDFDGTGGKAAKLGFKRVGVKAQLASTLDKTTVIAAMKNNDGAVKYPGGNALGFTAVEIPPITSATIDLRSFLATSKGEVTFVWDDLENIAKNLNLKTYINTADAAGIDSVTLGLSGSINLTAPISTNLTELYGVAESTNNILKINLKTGSFKLPKSGATISTPAKVDAQLLKSLTFPIPSATHIDINYNDFEIDSSFNISDINNYINIKTSNLPDECLISTFKIENIPYSDFNITIPSDSYSLTLDKSPNSTTYSIIYSTFNTNTVHTTNTNLSEPNPFLQFKATFTRSTNTKDYLVCVCDKTYSNNNGAGNNDKIILNSTKLVQLANIDKTTDNTAAYCSYKSGVVTVPSDFDTTELQRVLFYINKNKANISINYVKDNKDITDCIAIDNDTSLFGILDITEDLIAVYLKNEPALISTPIIFWIFDSNTTS
ncbi:MAG: hypothetical protein J6A25_00760 [Lachnospiraceae bacterium]|nr:hypothetical protein [Lachnospiraceae bacterium]